MDNTIGHSPEPPSLIWDLQMVMKNHLFTERDDREICQRSEDLSVVDGNKTRQEHHRPHIPPFRTTSDGRVTIGTAGGIKPHFRTVKPELLNKPFIKSENGSHLIDSGSFRGIFDLMSVYPWRTFGGVPVRLEPGHSAICDGTPLNNLPNSTRSNPYQCVHNGSPADCYDLTYVFSAKIPSGLDHSLVDMKTNKIAVNNPALADHFERVDYDFRIGPQSPNVRTRSIYQAKEKHFFAHPDNYKFQFYSVDLKVIVSNPKTVDARVEWVEAVDDSLKQSRTFKINVIKEPVFTADGRLMITRIGKNVKHRWSVQDGLTWSPNNGSEYENVYFAAGPDDNPCDVSKWETMQPFSYAYLDPKLNRFANCSGPKCEKRYGFAAYPLRDGENNIIPAGVDMGGSYPWISKSGAMVAFTLQESELAKSGLPYSCVSNEENCNKNFEFANVGRGFAMAGLWTKGKAVYIDGLINHIDFGLRGEERFHQYAYLYDYMKDGQAKSLGVAIGNGRMPKGTKDKDYYTPLHSAGNVNFIDSLENLFNDQPFMKPQGFADVIWQMNTGAVSSEVYFDDYLNLNTFISSPMTASTKLSPRNETVNIMRYQNGVIEDTQKHLANDAAASLDHWEVPKAGELKGRGRIEPVALGGVHGRGLWLTSQGQVDYSYKVDSKDNVKNLDLKNHPIYMGIFLDPRFSNDNKPRTLLQFSDGSHIKLQGRHTFVFERNGEVLASEKVPYLDYNNEQRLPYKKWSHLGFSFNPNRTFIKIYLNGLFYKNVHFSKRFFNFGLNGANTISIGSLSPKHPGIRGWVDEFKVFILKGEDKINPEIACNQARGSLVSWNPKSEFNHKLIRIPKRNAAFFTRSDRQIANLLPDNYLNKNFFCVTDYTSERGATKNDLAQLELASSGQILSVRDRLLFPESFRHDYLQAGLTFNHPRPDSTNNKFCLSCHGDQEVRTLSTRALRYIEGRTIQLDMRRQPTQPPRVLRGQLPQGRNIRFPDAWDRPGEDW
tara:strand:- start:5733 stop:8732 length:3000 start_codon:yes stop_codon:yes gene_type:complete